jgi:hypothetical protein
VTELTRGIGRAQNERIRKMRKPKSTLYLAGGTDDRIAHGRRGAALNVLHRLVDEGNTVIVIEHNLSVIAKPITSSISGRKPARMAAKSSRPGRRKKLRRIASAAPRRFCGVL